MFLNGIPVKQYLNLMLASDFTIMTFAVFIVCTLFFSSTVLFLFAQEYRLSVCDKLCYAIGGAPNQVAGSAAAFFLQIYLLDIAHVSSTRNLYRFPSTLVSSKMSLEL